MAFDPSLRKLLLTANDLQTVALKRSPTRATVTERLALCD
jgi:hypothetical protein